MYHQEGRLTIAFIRKKYNNFSQTKHIIDSTKLLQLLSLDWALSNASITSSIHSERDLDPLEISHRKYGANEDRNI